MREHDIIIIGGVVTGTALFYVINKYTDYDVGIIEKYKDFGLVNSKSNNNSQTLHFGDIETNYTIQKATKVKAQAELVKEYVEAHKNEKLFTKYHKMVLAVGTGQVKKLTKRYEEFKHLFPYLKLLDKEQIGKYEPKVVEGRTEDIIALFSPEGYTVDFGRLSKSFIKNSKNHNIKKNHNINLSIT